MTSGPASRLPVSPILIAGAGIGGLAAALALAERGLNAQIFEKRAAPSEDGAGIQIGPNGVHVLRQLGVAQTLAPLTASPEALHVMDGVSGRTLTRMQLGRPFEERHGAPYWTAHRADLHAALLRAARTNPLISLTLGAEVTGAENFSGHVAIKTGDGATIKGAALIAADGSASRLRGQIFKSAPLSYSGSVACRAVISASDLPGGLSPAATHIWLTPTAHAVHYPVRGGDEIALVAVIARAHPAGAPGAVEEARTVRAQFHRAAPFLKALIARAPEWRGWPLMVMASPPPHRVAGRIARIGDAAHPILPFLAQGAVMALEDAAVLASELARTPQSIADALSRYAGLRAPRSLRVARAAERNGRLYHLGGPLAPMRNAVLRASSPDRLINTYDWLYGWRLESAEH